MCWTISWIFTKMLNYSFKRATWDFFVAALQLAKAELLHCIRLSYSQTEIKSKTASGSALSTCAVLSFERKKISAQKGEVTFYMFLFHNACRATNQIAAWDATQKATRTKRANVLANVGSLCLFLWRLKEHFWCISVIKIKINSKITNGKLKENRYRVLHSFCAKGQ